MHHSLVRARRFIPAIFTLLTAFFLLSTEAYAKGQRMGVPKGTRITLAPEGREAIRAYCLDEGRDAPLWGTPVHNLNGISAKAFVQFGSKPPVPIDHAIQAGDLVVEGTGSLKVQFKNNRREPAKISFEEAVQFSDTRETPARIILPEGDVDRLKQSKIWVLRDQEDLKNRNSDPRTILIRLDRVVMDLGQPLHVEYVASDGTKIRTFDSLSRLGPWVKKLTRRETEHVFIETKNLTIQQAEPARKSILDATGKTTSVYERPSGENYKAVRDGWLTKGVEFDGPIPRPSDDFLRSEVKVPIKVGGQALILRIVVRSKELAQKIWGRITDAVRAARRRPLADIVNEAIADIPDDELVLIELQIRHTDVGYLVIGVPRTSGPT